MGGVCVHGETSGDSRATRAVRKQGAQLAAHTAPFSLLHKRQEMSFWRPPTSVQQAKQNASEYQLVSATSEALKIIFNYMIHCFFFNMHWTR